MSTHFKTILFVLGVVIGIMTGEVSPYASEVAVGAVLLVTTQGALLVYRRWSISHSGYEIPLITILLCAGLCLGIIREQLVTEKDSYVCEKSCTFDAMIVSSPSTKDAYQMFAVHALKSDDDTLDIQVRAPLYPLYEIGDTLHLSGKVSVPGVIAPHGATKSFDYAAYLRTQNVGSEMIYPHIDVIDHDAHDLTSILGRWKEALISRIEMYVSSPASSLAAGMLFGDASLSQELTQTFRVAGLSHIIVLSGFNIAILITAILFLLRFLPLVLRVTVAALTVVVFVMMVGGEASVIRATLMASAALFATLVGRAYVARQALVLSLLSIIMYEPYALLHDVSLHLSFLATVGIVYMSAPLGVILENYISRTSALYEVISITLAAYLATLPYICYTFGTMSVYALIANVLVLPSVPLAMLVSFLVVIFSYVSHILAVLLGFVDTTLINMMIWVAKVIQSLPLSSVTLTISFPTMCAMYVSITMLMMLFIYKHKNETRRTDERGIITDTISY